jgi:di/tricarboxylate transporter
MILVFVILAITIGLFISDRMRLDLVALLSLLALTITGVLSASEALAGFSSSLVIMIAGLFIVGAGLFETGVADRIGRFLSSKAGNDPTRLMLLLMLASAFLSAFMSSTGTVAVMLPVALSLARDANISPSKLLIPMSFGSLLGGMQTLIGTPPNVAVSNELVSRGLEPFNFFSFTPVGLAMLAVGLAFMALFGQRLLPDRRPQGSSSRLAGTPSAAELGEDYALADKLFLVRVPSDSALSGKRVVDLKLRRRYNVTVVALAATSKTAAKPPAVTITTADSISASATLPAADTSFDHADVAERTSLVPAESVLYVAADPTDLARMVAEESLELLGKTFQLPDNTAVVEVLIRPRSRFTGKTVRALKFFDRYNVNVLAIKRRSKLIQGDISETSLQAGDALLVSGNNKALMRLRSERYDFVTVTESSELEHAAPRAERAPWAIASMLLMLVLMTLGLTANVIAVLIGAVAMILSRCVNMEDAYRAIHWESVVLIAAILPMATALETTGGMNLIVSNMVNQLGSAPPIVMMAALFVLTSLFSQVMSNTATTVLLAPIAFEVAQQIGVSPMTLLMTVAIAASTAFATPIASPVNTLVLNPGNYHFTDFTRVGVPLQILLLLTSLIIVPIFFPF